MLQNLLRPRPIGDAARDFPSSLTTAASATGAAVVFALPRPPYDGLPKRFGRTSGVCSLLDTAGASVDPDLNRKRLRLPPNGDLRPAGVAAVVVVVVVDVVVGATFVVTGAAVVVVVVDVDGADVTVVKSTAVVKSPSSVRSSGSTVVPLLSASSSVVASAFEFSFAKIAYKSNATFSMSGVVASSTLSPETATTATSVVDGSMSVASTIGFRVDDAASDF